MFFAFHKLKLEGVVSISRFCIGINFALQIFEFVQINVYRGFKHVL